MKTTVTITKAEAAAKLVTQIQREFDMLGLNDYEVINVEITQPWEQQSNEQFLTNNKIRMIKFMRQILADVAVNKIPYDGQQNSNTCGLATAKAYVEEYFK